MSKPISIFRQSLLAKKSSRIDNNYLHTDNKTRTRICPCKYFSRVPLYTLLSKTSKNRLTKKALINRKLSAFNPLSVIRYMYLYFCLSLYIPDRTQSVTVQTPFALQFSAHNPERSEDQSVDPKCKSERDYAETRIKKRSYCTYHKQTQP